MSPCVIAIVKGGLGNQLFIYAAARALALRTGRALFLDSVSGFQQDAYGREFRLERLPINARQSPRKWIPWPTLRHPRHKLLRAANKLLPRSWRNYYAERRHIPPTQLTDLVLRRERIFLNGYWQSEDYFKDCEHEIRRELVLPIPENEHVRKLGEEMSSSDSVFLHARRVHYTPLLRDDYYQQAIDEASTQLPNPRFYLFGDDLAWPRQNLSFRGKPVNVVDVESGDEFIDLWLMSRCRHAIIANSSFSWWGAWLGTKPAGTGRFVFAPENSGTTIRPATGWRRVSNSLE